MYVCVMLLSLRLLLWWTSRTKSLLLGSPWAFFGALGHLLVSPWTPFGTRTKKETKSDMEDPRFGVQVGTQNRHFSGKSGNKHEKMGSQTGSGKRVLS